MTYVNNHGRAMVRMPDHPTAYGNGYVLRSHAAYFEEHGEGVPSGWNLHHRNEDKLDDRIENLALVLAGAHIHYHKKTFEPTFCRGCGEVYDKPSGKRNSSKFCSRECYWRAGGRHYRRLICVP